MKWTVVPVALLLILAVGPAVAQQPSVEVLGEVTVSGPFIPVLTPALRDMPEAFVDESLFGVEAKRRDTHGIVVPEVNQPPHDNVLADLQHAVAAANPEAVRAFSTPIVNVEGLDYNVYPPDPTGDVGPNHVVQGVNGSTSVVRILNKTGGTLVSARYLDDLASTSPCNSGYCDPVVQYDQAADRWLLTEFASSGSNLCVYVSQTADPTGAYYAYRFSLSSFPDYPKYGVWPAASNSAYFVGANNGGTVVALERDAMLAGQPADMITKTIGNLSGWGFQLTVPATHEGATLPPSASGCVFGRPRDTEIHGGTCTNCDLMELWEFKVDWNTPANSTLTQLTGVQMADWDQTLCGTSAWNCMPQSGTSQKLDPIREPLHFPLQYRNWGSYETLVGAFVEDVNGTDKAAVHWFEFRRTPPGSGNWTVYQEGVLGNDTYHRAVASAAMDGSGNIGLGYTRTSSSSYAGSYYAGRLAGDTLGTISTYDNVMQAGSSYQSGTERWGDYAGIGVDPSDDCTFWFFGMYEEGTNDSATRIASFKFDSCGGGGSAPTVTGVSPNSGSPAGGTTVTITGTNFTGATAVAFGATAATSFTVNSATQISAVSPAGSGTVHVTVTTPFGTSATSTADQFTYASGATPTVTGLVPTSGLTTGGTSVTITGTNFTGATAVKFGATNATSFTVNSATQITAVSPSGTGTVYVTVTTPGGTSATGSACQFTYVTPGRPSVTSLSPSSGTTAGGTSVTLTGTNFTGATAVKFGTSSAASFTVNSNTQIVAVTPPRAAGIVFVTVTGPGGTSSTGPTCRFTYVSGGAPPTVTALSPNSGPAAGGTSVTITGTNFSGVTAVKFGTSNATSYTVVSTTQITAVSPVGSGVVYVTVAAAGGTSSAGAASQFTYTSGTGPAVTGLNPTSGPTAGGTTVTVTGVNFSGATAVQFGATNATSFTVNSSTQITAVSPAGTGTVHVTVTTPGGTSAPTAADQFTYASGVAPTVTGLLPNGGPSAGNTTVKIMGTGFTGATSVKFGAADARSFLILNSTTIRAVSPAGTGTVYVTVTTPGGTSAQTAASQYTYR
jgi:hypothetical protein